MPKLTATSGESNIGHHSRPYSTQDASQPFNYGETTSTEEKKSTKIVLSKNQIKCSRNKPSLDLKSQTKSKLMNTYQPSLPTHTVSVCMGISIA